MKRVAKAYEQWFREALRRFGAREVDKGVALLKLKGIDSGKENGAACTRAWIERQLALQSKLARFQRQRVAKGPEIRFICDEGLGGLARWIRACGYWAGWQRGLIDEAVLEWAMLEEAVLVTTDSLLLERRVVASGDADVLWVPPTVTPDLQLRIVLGEFGLGRLDSRCMECGGELKRVNKHEVREQIPPRTFRWLEEFWACRSCGKLFWKGSHWERIEKQLDQATVMEVSR